MTQDELWLEKYKEVVAFVNTHHRNPSRYDPEERALYVNWLKHNKKLLNAGQMREDRAAMFRELLALCGWHRRKNQYCTAPGYEETGVLFDWP